MTSPLPDALQRLADGAKQAAEATRLLKAALDDHVRFARAMDRINGIVEQGQHDQTKG